jgi:hypothetical protein
MPEDFLKDVDKFSPLVKNVQNVLQETKPKIVSSEDRTFHCGNLHPELMSVSYLVVAKVHEVPCMVTASSMQRVNKSRDVIFPYGFTDLTMLENVEYEMKIRRRSTASKTVPQMKCYYHGMQGCDHVGSGMINTITCVGFAEADKLITNEIDKYFVFTTADDAVRAFVMNPGCDALSTSNCIVEKPINYYNHMMMINNDRKIVKSETIAEANNIAIGKFGMITQSPIYSTLMCQPLTNSNPYLDLRQLISDAKKCIYWGMSPNISLCSINSGLEMFKQKWLATQEQIDVLTFKGFIPTTFEEILCETYNQEQINCMLEIAKPEMRELILNNERKIDHVFSRKFGSHGDKEFELKVVNKTSMFSFDYKCDQIFKSRAIGNRLNPMWTRQMPVKVKKERFRNFMKAVTNTTSNYQYDQPNCNVKVMIRERTNNDMLPVTIGESHQ